MEFMTFLAGYLDLGKKVKPQIAPDRIIFACRATNARLAASADCSLIPLQVNRCVRHLLNFAQGGKEKRNPRIRWAEHCEPRSQEVG